MAEKATNKAGEKRREDDKEPAAGKKKPMALIGGVIGIVVLLAAFLVGQKVSAKSHPAKPAKVEAGPVMPLDEFLVNLADPGGDHFLKITVNLGLSKEKGKTAEGLKEQTAEIRDAVLTTLGNKNRDDITPVKGREKLKTDIKKAVNSALGEDDVQDVYFTNFVTQ